MRLSAIAILFALAVEHSATALSWKLPNIKTYGLRAQQLVLGPKQESLVTKEELPDFLRPFPFPRRPFHRPAGFIALGDSYSAGIGTGFNGTEDDCRHGLHGYPILIHEDLEDTEGPNRTTFQHLACTGSTIDDMLAGSPVSQIDQFNTTSTADFALLSIGGNDLGFFEIMNNCIFRFYGPYSGTCEMALQNSEQAIAGKDFEHRLRIAIMEILDRVKWEKRPWFTITVTGYAQFFNAETEDCDERSLAVWYRGPKLKRELRQRMNAMVLSVNQKIRNSIDTINSEFLIPRVFFVDYDAEFEGHRFCEPGVIEPDSTRNETWFFLVGGPDNGEGAPPVPPPAHTPSAAPSITPSQGRAADPQRLHASSPLIDPDICLEPAKKSGDWGKMALCLMAMAARDDPTLRAASGEFVAQNSMWYVPTYYGKTFHPRSLGHRAMRRKIYELWEDLGFGFGLGLDVDAQASLTVPGMWRSYQHIPGLHSLSPGIQVTSCAEGSSPPPSSISWQCDKLRPDCSQCVRVGKKCPGYRDQLSLMFRDESSKVIQKAHAQWGVGEGPNDSSSSSPSSSSSTSSNSPKSTSSTQASPNVSLSAPVRRFSTASTASSTSVAPVVRIIPPVTPSLDDQGVDFFVNRYIIGHPDEPRTAEEFKMAEWSADPALRDVMVAVGLAGLSNLKADKQQSLFQLARERYGKALRSTGQLVQSRRAPSLEVTMRAVVSLAMFELVKGEDLDINNVHVHIMGGVALMRSWCPIPNTAFGGVRALYQLSYTMFVSAHMTGTQLPPVFHDWMAFGRALQADVDIPATDLGVLISQFVDLSSIIRNRIFIDGHASTASTIQQLFAIDQSLEQWESSLHGPWLYRTKRDPTLPSKAVFQGDYHIYHDMWFARIWNHYRWARLLVNETIVEMVENYPLSSNAIESYDKAVHLGRVRTLARDLLVSIPTHWRHPLLGDRMPQPLENHGGSGAGAAGLVLAIFQFKAAACAMGVPDEYWDWTHDILQCIWSDMGMLHARNLMGQMETHRARMQESQSLWVLA
ncbi:SAGA-associated factor 73 [Paramyrothecium foliicola]|nr:SAGA-associated factor 73 [Paramyrothecium foliicola]